MVHDDREHVRSIPLTGGGPWPIARDPPWHRANAATALPRRNRRLVTIACLEAQLGTCRVHAGRLACSWNVPSGTLLTRTEQHEWPIALFEHTDVP